MTDIIDDYNEIMRFVFCTQLWTCQPRQTLLSKASAEKNKNNVTLFDTQLWRSRNPVLALPVNLSAVATHGAIFVVNFFEIVWK